MANSSSHYLYYYPRSSPVHRQHSPDDTMPSSALRSTIHFAFICVQINRAFGFTVSLIGSFLIIFAESPRIKGWLGERVTPEHIALHRADPWQVVWKWCYLTTTSLFVNGIAWIGMLVFVKFPHNYTDSDWRSLGVTGIERVFVFGAPSDHPAAIATSAEHQHDQPFVEWHGLIPTMYSVALGISIPFVFFMWHALFGTLDPSIGSLQNEVIHRLILLPWLGEIILVGFPFRVFPDVYFYVIGWLALFLTWFCFGQWIAGISFYFSVFPLISMEKEILVVEEECEKREVRRRRARHRLSRCRDGWIVAAPSSASFSQNEEVGGQGEEDVVLSAGARTSSLEDGAALQGGESCHSSAGDDGEQGEKERLLGARRSTWLLENGIGGVAAADEGEKRRTVWGKTDVVEIPIDPEDPAVGRIAALDEDESDDETLDLGEDQKNTDNTHSSHKEDHDGDQQTNNDSNRNSCTQQQHSPDPSLVNYFTRTLPTRLVNSLDISGFSTARLKQLLFYEDDYCWTPGEHPVPREVLESIPGVPVEPGEPGFGRGAKHISTSDELYTLAVAMQEGRKKWIGGSLCEVDYETGTLAYSLYSRPLKKVPRPEEQLGRGGLPRGSRGGSSAREESSCRGEVVEGVDKGEKGESSSAPSKGDDFKKQILPSIKRDSASASKDGASKVLLDHPEQSSSSSGVVPPVPPTDVVEEITTKTYEPGQVTAVLRSNVVHCLVLVTVLCVVIAPSFLGILWAWDFGRALIVKAVLPAPV